MATSEPAQQRAGVCVWNDGRMRSSGSCSLVAFLAIAVAGCGEPPRRTPIDVQPGTHSNAPARPTEVLPGDEAIRIVGEVELRGALATPPAEAVVFVSVKPREGEFASMPALSLRIELAPLASASTDVLRVPFVVTGVHTMAGGPPLAASLLPGAIDVEALYDPTGGLRDKERLVRQRVPVDGPRAEGVTVVLGAG